jgi:4-hydroxybutyryl-CoA dehydratase/vinylacetyl-CoA-Delta-isomerase
MHREDLAGTATMTDIKGDRSKRPIEQSDPDMYLHVVERRKDGIVVRGARAHQSGALQAHELLIMPTRAVREDEKDYAVGFAISTNADGVIQICGRQPSDLRRLEGMEIDWGMPLYGGTESLVIFDDVFVPWDRVFLNGEWDFTRDLVVTFANYHRVIYALKCSLGDLLIGATAQIAEYNGLEKASHIRSKLLDMVILNETLWACGLAAASQGVQTPSGLWVDDPVLSNVVKFNVTRNMYEIARLAEEIAGGQLSTQPSEKDYRNLETRPYIEKYLKGVDGVPTEHRMRMFKLLENLTYGQGATYSRFESMHGAGSPEAQKLSLARDFDFEDLKKFARETCGIEKKPE